MKVLYVNVGLPRSVEYRSEFVASGIFREPVANLVKVNELKADLSVHGGYYKAVYVYPSENYDFWRNEFS